MKNLKVLGVIRSHNNPVGDYGEYLAKNILGLEIAPPSSKGFDAVDRQGVRFQIKTRRLTEENGSRQLGGFRDLDQRLFDFCIAIMLNEDFTPLEVWKIPHSVILKYAQNTTRGFKRVILAGSILREPGVTRLR